LLVLTLGPGEGGVGSRWVRPIEDRGPSRPWEVEEVVVRRPLRNRTQPGLRRRMKDRNIASCTSQPELLNCWSVAVFVLSCCSM